MTDNEIIKALECCKAHQFMCENDCPLFLEDECGTILPTEALDLINRLKAEIERFKDIESTVDEFWIGLQKMSIFKGKDKPTLEELLEYIEQVKVEAHKEFAEKLKKRKQMFPRADGVVHAVSVSTIDRILAERVGDNNV